MLARFNHSKIYLLDSLLACPHHYSAPDRAKLSQDSMSRLRCGTNSVYWDILAIIQDTLSAGAPLPLQGMLALAMMKSSFWAVGSLTRIACTLRPILPTFWPHHVASSSLIRQLRADAPRQVWVACLGVFLGLSCIVDRCLHASWPEGPADHQPRDLCIAVDEAALGQLSRSSLEIWDHPYHPRCASRERKAELTLGQDEDGSVVCKMMPK